MNRTSTVCCLASLMIGVTVQVSLGESVSTNAVSFLSEDGKRSIEMTSQAFGNVGPVKTKMYKPRWPGRWLGVAPTVSQSRPVTVAKARLDTSDTMLVVFDVSKGAAGGAAKNGITIFESQCHLTDEAKKEYKLVGTACVDSVRDSLTVQAPFPGAVSVHIPIPEGYFLVLAFSAPPPSSKVTLTGIDGFDGLTFVVK